MTTLPKRRQSSGSQTAPTTERITVPTQVRTQAGAYQGVSAGSRWSDTGFWRRWAMRLLGLWVLLNLALVAQRVATADIRPGLLDARETHQQLVEQRDALSLEVQSLGNAGRIRQRAEEAGMLRFADSEKRSAPFAGITPPPVATASESTQPLHMSVQWGHSEDADAAPTTAPATAPAKPATP